MTISENLENAKKLKYQAAVMSSEQKTSALINIAAAIEDDAESILRANNADLQALQGIMPDIKAEKCRISAEFIAKTVDSIRQLAKLPDPVGSVISETENAEGARVSKVAVPLGVIAVVFNNPVLTFAAVALALKSGNVLVMKTGRETYGSARAVFTAVRKGLKKAGVSQNISVLVEDATSKGVEEILSATGYVDLLIPVCGKKMTEQCIAKSKVPLMCTDNGIRHIYIDEYADEEKAVDITERFVGMKGFGYGVCIVHKNAVPEFLPRLHARLVSARYKSAVKFRLDKHSHEVLGGWNNCVLHSEAGESDCGEAELHIKCVDGIKEAVAHISSDSKGVSEIIVSENTDNVKFFVRAVDSAEVCVNDVSSFPADFGTDFLGISTQKFPARGPIGLSELTSYKYVVMPNDKR